jgi:3-dehydroquinate dehydratase
MNELKQKLIVTIANYSFDEIVEIVKNYKQIELRIDKLNLSSEQILTIIDLAELAVITDFSENLDTTFPEIKTTDKQSQNVIVSYSHHRSEFFEQYPFYRNSNVRKMLSFHSFDTQNDSITKLFDDLITKYFDDRFKYIKFAVYIETQEHLNELYDVRRKYRELSEKLILIPLGEKFKYERKKFLECGIPYMFCHLGRPVFSYQLHYSDYFDNETT